MNNPKRPRKLLINSLDEILNSEGGKCETLAEYHRRCIVIQHVLDILVSDGTSSSNVANLDKTQVVSPLAGFGELFLKSKKIACFVNYFLEKSEKNAFCIYKNTVFTSFF